MDNFLQRLARNPYQPIDGASVTRIDELGNGYDDWNNLIAPNVQQPEQTWGETALGIATAPARLATALAGSLSPYGADGWRVPPIINEGVDAITAVGDAYTGKMVPEEIPSRALGMAGFMMGGGGPAMALERSLAQRGINSTADMIPTAIRAGQEGYQLRRVGDVPAGDGYRPFNYEILNQAGSLVGRAEGYVTPENTMWFDWLGAPEGAAPLNLGRQGIRQLREQVRSDFPEVKTFQGGRISGSRAQGADMNNPESFLQTVTLAANADSKASVPAIAGALDMSTEARLARAREMGFDTSRTLYHGTDRDFESFNPSKSGAYGPGVYVTPDADYANRYAIGRSGWEQDTRVMPLHVRGELADGMLYESLKREVRAAGVPEDQIGQAVQQQLRDMGYAGVEGMANQAVAVFDPANIRSVNAAFDPAQSSSANILAANADSRPALLAGALGQEPDIPDWLLPFLGR